MNRRANIGRISARDKRGGFLLVEAMTTMAISAFLLVALVSTVTLVLRASQRASDAAEEIETTSRLISAMARDVEVAVPARWAGTDAGFILSGSSDTLTMVQQATDADGVTQNRLLQFQSRAELGSGWLFRSQAELLPGARNLSEVMLDDPQVYYNGAYRVDFAYFVQMETGEEALLDVWTRSDRMPVAIRVSLVEPKTGRIRDSLRIPLRVDAEAGCAAPGIGRCSTVNAGSDGKLVDENGNEAAAPINPDDPMGWLSYGQQ